MPNVAYILSQSFNATRKGSDFLRPMDAGKLAQLILKNLYRTENTLSKARFCELSDPSKTRYGSQDPVRGIRVIKSK